MSIRVAGKNLVPNDAGTTLNNGVTFTANSDGSITLNGTSSGDWAANVRLSLKKYPAGKYLVSGCPKDRKGTNARIVVASMDGSVVAIETGNGATIEVAKETELYFDIRTALGDVFDGMTFYPMMRLASITDATYEPYKEVQTLTLSTPNGLPGIPVTTGGNYTDETGQQWVCDEVDFGRGVYTKRVGIQVFDGSSDEGWSTFAISGGIKYRVQSTLLRYIILRISSTAKKADILCNMFVRTRTGSPGIWSGGTGIAVDPAGLIFCYTDLFNTSDVSLWTAYLAEHPMTVVYLLATPIETPLSAEELAAYAALHTNYPNTTILNDGGAGMEVKYCTPFTSVPMVHGEADSGKILVIDEHGCVTKIDSKQLDLHMELLWENANPTSDFAAQTVNIELNDYAYIGIDYIMNTSDHYRMWTQCAVGSIGAISFVHLRSADPTVFVDRCFVVNDSNIEFYNAYIATGTSSAVASYGYAVPIKIYGIK